MSRAAEVLHWRRRMRWSGAALVLGGTAMLLWGGLWAGMRLDEGAMTGIWVGTAGTLFVVLGAVFVKLALVGPLPRRWQDDVGDAEVGDR